MKRFTLAGMALLALPLFVSLGTSSIWDSNEAFYVQTPREMAEHGDWIVPRFNGQPRLNKPPLSYWLVAAAYSLFGVSVFWERLILAFLAYASVWAVFLSGRILVSERSALLAAVLFATTFRFQILARRLLIDVLLLFCILAALTAFLYWWKRNRDSGLVLAALFLGLGVLAKGPVILLPALILAVYTFLTVPPEQLRRAPWVRSLLVFCLVSSSWYLLLGFTQGWDSVFDFLWKENLGRFTHVDFGPQRGLQYYPLVFLADYLPWSILLLGALAGRWTSRQYPDRNLSTLLALWLGAFLVFFSLSHNKQEYYILPVYPVASLWLAAYLDRETLPGWSRWLICGVLLAVTTSLAVLAYSLFRDVAGWWLPVLLLAGVALGVAGSRIRLAAWTLSLFYALAFHVYLQPLEEYRPVRHLAEIIRSRIPSGDPVTAGYYRLSTPSLAYYLNSPVLELGTLGQALEALRAPRPVYLIMAADDYTDLKREMGPTLKIEGVRPKLYTTASTLVEGWKLGRLDTRSEAWTRPVYLVSNQGG